MAQPTPSERELEILKILWELGAASVRQVLDRMCPQGELAFNTVQTMLRNMEEKGLAGHRTEGRVFVYYPKHSRETVSSRFLHKVFDGALDELVLTMLEAEDVAPAEIKELERLIGKARRQREKQQRDNP